MVGASSRKRLVSLPGAAYGPERELGPGNNGPTGYGRTARMPALAPSGRTAAAATLGAVAATCAAYHYYHRYYKHRCRAAAVIRAFHRDGIAVVRGFASASECREMLSSMDALVEEWDPTETTSIFKTDASQSAAQGKDDYFMTSGDAVRFFLEPGAMDEASGALLAPKQEALNKVGHALHVYVPVFAGYAQSAKVRALVRSLGWQVRARPHRHPRAAPSTSSPGGCCLQG